MRKRVSPSYLFIFFSLLTLMSIPRDVSERMRGATVAAMAPMWHQLLAFKMAAKGYPEDKTAEKGSKTEEMERLRLENALMKEEIIQLKDVMQHEMRLLAKLSALGKPVEEAQKTIKLRHARDLEQLLKMHLKVVPARVIFRSPASWNSSMWINVGASTNDALSFEAIVKNSPVMIGTAVIGVIDYVGKNQSRVRLITDSGLSPSVRVDRGDAQNLRLKHKLEDVASQLRNSVAAFEDDAEKAVVGMALDKAAERLSLQGGSRLLAKGEVQGTSKPLWRSQRHLLKGTGFNYDFADGEGPARDLRTGEPLSSEGEQQTVSIVKAGDMLVTTGMDGVFPPGLLVAEVTKVHPLKEGDYFYELDALPVVGNIDDISLVFVLPPVGYDPEERASPFGWR